MVLSNPKTKIVAPLKPLLSSLVFGLLLVAPAQATTALKVALKDNVDQVTVGSSTPAVVRDATGKPLGNLEAMTAFRAVATSGKTIKLSQWQANQFWIDPKGDGKVWIGDRWYRGETRLINNDSDLTVINEVNVEHYLYSVVGSEMMASWPLEALKAQAVAARSYALYKQNHSVNSVFDLKSTTASQVYKGINSETPSTHQAVNQTQGQVLTHQGNVILAAFHSSSGGHTEDVEDVWNRPLPYLRGVVDYDQTAPVYQWQQTFSGKKMGRQLEEDVGQVQELIPQQRTPQGRIVNLKVVGDRATKTISGNAFRQALDLRSTLFDIHQTGQRFIISGRGFGHGIGLSQWGAYYLAKQGVNYRQILGHYYAQVKLARLENQVVRN